MIWSLRSREKILSHVWVLHSRSKILTITTVKLPHRTTIRYTCLTEPNTSCCPPALSDTHPEWSKNTYQRDLVLDLVVLSHCFTVPYPYKDRKITSHQRTLKRVCLCILLSSQLSLSLSLSLNFVFLSFRFLQYWSCKLST